MMTDDVANADGSCRSVPVSRTSSSDDQLIAVVVEGAPTKNTHHVVMKFEDPWARLYARSCALFRTDVTRKSVRPSPVCEEPGSYFGGCRYLCLLFGKTMA